MTNEQYQQLERRLMKLESMIIDIYDSAVRNKRICPICKSEIRLYLPAGEKNRPNCQCPVCRSLERHRTLCLYLDRNPQLLSGEGNKIKLLHFGPEAAFIDKFIKEDNIDYYPVDINPHFPNIREVVDITDIPYADNTFDLIICNHVMEHIPDEQRALKEMLRVLKCGKTAIINVPVFSNLDITLEKEEYNTPELRNQYYGQVDHVRKYGNDYMQRVSNSGFHVEKILPNRLYSPEELICFGIYENEEVYLCTKKTIL